MTTKYFLGFEDLLEYLYKHNYQQYVAEMLLDVAFQNYDATGKWYIEVEPTTDAIIMMKVKGIRLQICQN